MPATSWQAAVGGVVGLAMMVLGGDAAAEPNPTIAIRLEQPDGPTRLKVAQAQSIAAEIFGRAGVSLVWSTDTTEPVHRTFTVKLTTAAEAPAGPEVDAMGVTPRPGGIL